MSDDRRQRRRDEPRGPTRASAPDVEVFSLPDLEQPPTDELAPTEEQQPPSQSDEGDPPRWLDEVRTAIWEDSRQLEQPPLEEQPIKRRQTKKLPPGLSREAPSASAPSTPAPTPGPIRRGGSASRLHEFALHRGASEGREQGELRDVPYQPVPAERVLVRAAAPLVDVEEEPLERGGEPHLLEAPMRVSFNAVAQISPDPRLWVMTEPGSAAAEQYRVLALKLREGRSLRVVAFVAPTAQAEGCLAASNVSLALAEGNRNKVLLLDTNLRRPEVAALFGLQEGAGLGEQLRRHRRATEDPWEVCAVSRSLHILPAGAPEKNPSALLSSDALPDLIAEARRAFDYIVVAAPPVIESADINILQDHLDGAVLVVKARVTRRDSVAASVARLGAAKLLGVVLVGA